MVPQPPEHCAQNPASLGNPDPVLDRDLLEMMTAWPAEASLVNYFQLVVVEVGERQVIADAQGRTADGTWLTTL